MFHHGWQHVSFLFFVCLYTFLSILVFLTNSIVSIHSGFVDNPLFMQEAAQRNLNSCRLSAMFTLPAL